MNKNNHYTDGFTVTMIGMTLLMFGAAVQSNARLAYKADLYDYTIQEERVEDTHKETPITDTCVITPGTSTTAPTFCAWVPKP
jgi:hypothetical protein